MPLRWETPGGGCDHDDASVLAACARELAEEAGLRAVSVGPFVPLPPSLSSRGTAASVDRAPQDGEAQSESGKTTGGHFFRTRRGNLVCKFYFVVEAADGMDVVLDPNEHAAFVWATEQEVVQERTIASDGRESIGLQFTTVEQRAVLLEAFKLWRRDGSN